MAEFVQNSRYCPHRCQSFHTLCVLRDTGSFADLHGRALQAHRRYPILSCHLQCLELYRLQEMNAKSGTSEVH